MYEKCSALSLQVHCLASSTIYQILTETQQRSNQNSIAIWSEPDCEPTETQPRINQNLIVNQSKPDHELGRDSIKIEIWLDRGRNPAQSNDVGTRLGSDVGDSADGGRRWSWCRTRIHRSACQNIIYIHWGGGARVARSTATNTGQLWIFFLSFSLGCFSELRFFLAETSSFTGSRCPSPRDVLWAPSSLAVSLWAPPSDVVPRR